MSISSQAVDYFSGNLFNNLVDDGHTGNALASPIGLVTMLSMLLAGSSDTTFDQIAYAMNVANDQVDSLHDSFRELISRIDKKPVDHTNETYERLYLEPFTGYDLYIRSLAFTTSVITDSYVSFLESFYQAKIEQSVDRFDQASVMKKVNDWVKRTTYGKIPSILDEPPDVENLLLLNSVFFAAKWKEEFHPNYNKEPFLNDGVEEVMVDTMTRTGYCWYFETIVNGEEVQIIEILYFETSSMVIILPRSPTGINNIFRANINKVMHKFDYEKSYYAVNVVIPKFKVETTLDMIPILSAMGLEDMFKPSASFSPMTGSDNEIFVTQFIHKTRIEVDEKGTLAASVSLASTSKSKFLYSNITEFKADRPFALFIRDSMAGMKLFVAKIAKL